MKKINLIVFFLFAFLLGGLFFRFQQDNGFLDRYFDLNLNVSGSDSVYKYGRFDEVMRILQENYYNSEILLSGESKMIDGALRAYVDAIDDPYTVYMDSDQGSGFTSDLKGENDFEGIGAYIMKKDYYILVEEIVKNSPAFKSGLKPLDRIVMIDSGYVENLSIDEAVSKIRGPQGSQVNLLIERYDRDDNRTILNKTVTRDKVSVPSVVSEVIDYNGNKIGYLEIYIVGEETENLLEKEIIDLKQNNIDGIILDLRGNGGGFLPIAVEIASHFIPNNELVVSAQYKNFPYEKFYSKGYQTLQGLPVVVLIDGMTASAGEIIAMSMREKIGAILIGTQTFGKGSIQTVKEFQDNSLLKYTIGKWYSPDGKNIDEVGIAPDVVVEFDADKYQSDGFDNQMEEAKEILVNNL
ncbi:S41 family peptidase [Candidatus Gracilibacteria bacterium]|nr:S41 family peptidase [Candidatus Gracilibacteria bacterium]